MRRSFVCISTLYIYIYAKVLNALSNSKSRLVCRLANDRTRKGMARFIVVVFFFSHKSGSACKLANQDCYANTTLINGRIKFLTMALLFHFLNQSCGIPETILNDDSKLWLSVLQRLSGKYVINS